MSYGVKDGGGPRDFACRAASARAWLAFSAVALLACSSGDQTSSARGGDSTTPSGSGTAGASTASKTSAAIPGGNVASGVGGSAGTAAGRAPLPAQPGTTQGMFKPAAQLDPKAHFDWQETTPSANQCQPGTYTGTFDCGFVPDGSPAGTMPFDVSGPITVTLKRSMNGEFLEISDGDLYAQAQGIFGLRAKLMGTLDCKTLMLTATATDGAWALGDPNMPLLPGGTFAGMLTGRLDPPSGMLGGDWALDSGAGNNATIPGTCPGTWTTMFMP